MSSHPGSVIVDLPKTVALIACVAGKRSSPAPAASLYTSDWFYKARAYAEHHADSWYVLSALHGVLAPDEFVDPYNLSLNTVPAAERRAWGNRVLAQLVPVLRSGDQAVVLAGRHYREPIVESLRARGVDVLEPLARLGIGEQKRWLKEQVVRP